MVITHWSVLLTIDRNSPTVIKTDSAKFLEHFVQAGFHGGHDAAHLLQDRLRDYFKVVCSFKAHWQVVVRIFANFSGLAKTYYDAGVVPETRTVREFLIGFNRELPLSKFIDAGSDKEAADRKIQGIV